MTQDVTVTASFTLKPYSLIYTAGPGGTLSGAPVQVVLHGSDGTPVTAVPNTGYSFSKWSDDITDNPRTDVNVTDDISVSAVFLVDTYELVYSAGTGGTLSGEAVQTVAYGESGSAVTAEPAEGYVFVDWSDGRTDNPRVDADVTASLEVMANFAMKPVEGEGEQPVEGEGEPPVEGEGELPVEGEGETPVEGEGEAPVEGEGEIPAEGEGEAPVEGEGELPVEGEGEIVVEGEGELPVEGEGEIPAEGEGEVQPEGEGETPAEGEGETPVEGEGEIPAEGEGEIRPKASEVTTEGEGEIPAEGEGEVPAEGEGEVSAEGEGEVPPKEKVNR